MKEQRVVEENKERLYRAVKNQTEIMMMMDEITTSHAGPRDFKITNESARGSNANVEMDVRM